ncbi:SDR family oxidoreductase [Paraburkholderia sp. MMS20-SJTR3]|uniref:SDR family oxidoreductase n=1 Tax=Paraburkholderia sejongensis TaxID=2886946 RepID=A0ABS8K0S9_9BURK|nr:SDR family oxidoreductase [Paraburkholderia sp. MMS20-SJTR3]MCC8395767.1 SDR family oxidoreductase [Paraburkholderia sp. MMS20-SJTR3]
MQQVIVTGVGNGIGAAVARKCVAQGATVIGCDIDGPAIERLAREFPRDSFFGEVVDVGDLGALRRFFGRCTERFDCLDGLVNNAGLYHGKSVYKYSDDEIDRIIAVNLTALIHLSKDFAAHVQQTGKRAAIVNLTSVAGEVGSSDALYGSTKAAVIGLTKSNAMNFAPYLRVNAVSPALIRETAIYHRIPQYRLEEYQRQETLKEPILPEGVADVVMFLLSDASRHLTGKIVPVDNGAYPR